MACILTTIISAAQSSKLVAAASLLCLAVGAFKTAAFALSLVRFFVETFVQSGISLRKYGSAKGSWAIVTGASDGIGKEYSLQLARAGFNVFLVSRTESKLVALATEIKATYRGVTTKQLALDFSSAGDADYAAFAAVVDELGVDIGVLVNNVGQSHSIPVPFAEVDIKELTDIITINDLATLKITRIVVPKLLLRKKERKLKSLILTMGSFGGYFPTPYLSVYSGSKAFLQHWSSALATELAPAGVDVELVLSYLVTSAMSKIRKTSMLIPNPRQFVRATLSSIGLARGAQGMTATSTPYWSHALFQYVVSSTIGVYSSIVASSNLSMHVSIRKRALRKAEREQKSQ
ncbi:uncharacterized protein V1518DRAFT_411182 [Limtongia smithiae]|uniref:uncharacterized protein n=1 Tax=Limtongia smithiae TaxID=1125753 RepID=UPI0034CFCC9D